MSELDRLIKQLEASARDYAGSPQHRAAYDRILKQINSMVTDSASLEQLRAIRNASRLMEERSVAARGISKGGRPYESQCWNCGTPVHEKLQRCPHCDWFMCPSCGACGCPGSGD